MVVSTMPIWVRLPNLPLPFWHHKVLEDIGSTLGKFKKIDLEKPQKGLFTFSRICMEIDLRKFLPYHIILKHKKIPWFQVLDYKKMTF